MSDASSRQAPPPPDPDPDPEDGRYTRSLVKVLSDELDLIQKRRDHRAASPRRAGKPECRRERREEAARRWDRRGRMRRDRLRREAVREEIEAARAVSEDGGLMRARVAMLEEGVAGLALSGGGIRSATFAVGFLQGLAHLGLIGRFDYLSSVSGGGYAMGWLAAWLKREGDPENVERQLDFSRVGQASARRHGFERGRRDRPVDEEPQPLRHLRSFSSYLFPRPGLLSVDVWTVVMIWLRNVAINLLMLLPLAMLAVLLARLCVFGFDFMNADRSPNLAWGQTLAWASFVAGAAAAWSASRLNAMALPEFRAGEPRPPGVRAASIVAVAATLAAALGMTAGSRWVWRDVSEWASERLDFGRNTVGGNLVGLVKEYPDLLQPPSFAVVTALFAGGLAFGAFWIAIQDSARRILIWSALAACVGLALRVPAPRLGAAMLLASLGLAAWAFFGVVVPGGRVRWAFVWAAAASGASAGLLFVLLLGLVQTFARMDRPDLMATFAVPGALWTTVAATVVEVAAAGRAMSEEEREWWGRFCARLGVISILWLAGMGAILHLPGLFLWGGTFARTALASGWVATTAVGVLTGRFVLPRLQGRGGGGLLAAAAAVAPPVFLLGLLGLVGLLASLLLNSPSLLAPNASDFPHYSYYIRGVGGTSGWLIAALIAASASLATLGFMVIDVNAFSLHRMYTNRLVRCYLGASRPVPEWASRWAAPRRDMRVAVGAPSLSEVPEDGSADRDPHPVSRFAMGDDLPLALLRIGSGRGPGPAGAGERGKAYWGPQLLINATLNLAGGSDLAWRSRKGESFLLSPLYCGSKSLGYALAPDGGEAPTAGAGRAMDNITLGRCMAVSGAAVDPSMRSLESRALTALLTLFNARLGAWVQNPRHVRLSAWAVDALLRPNPAAAPGARPDARGGWGRRLREALAGRFASWLGARPDEGWRADSPRFGGLLLTELFGGTDADGPYVHLSDGGHFENLGAYELIRRRCRYVVALDAGDEVGSSSSNLADLVRLCRIDFGVRIQIDTEPLRPAGEERLSRAHAVVGRIRYDDVDQGQLPGILVYVKVSMTGDEPPDLQNYARCNSRFPYQPTDLRQSFDERQFESYRCLGDHIAVKVFGDAAASLRGREGLAPAEYASRLFSALEGRLGDAFAGQGPPSAEAARAWAEVHRDLRSDPALARLSRQLYPDLPPAPAPPASRPAAEEPPPDYDRAEAHAVGQMLQIMEDAWRTLGLARLSDLPMNRGWVNVFRRWVDTPAFQSLWPSLRPQYGADFVRFCEQELHLRAPAPILVPLDGHPRREPAGRRLDRRAEIGKLAREFDREWAGSDVPSLGELIERSRALRPGGPPPAWLIVQRPSPTRGAAGGPSGEPFAVGLVLAAAFDDIDRRFPGALEKAERTEGTFGGRHVELVAWMRRGYRSAGLAAPQVEAILREGGLARALGLPPGSPLPTLWARYPKSGAPGDADHEHGVWLAFLARFDFRPLFPKQPRGWGGSMMRLRTYPTSAPGRPGRREGGS